MTTRIWNPKDGMAFQGDVAIVPLPDNIAVDQSDEIRPRDGKLILQEGEMTGHHHHVAIDPTDGRSAGFRPASVAVADPYAGMSPDLRQKMSGQRAERVGTARMFRDRKAADALVAANILARTDLCVGFMLVEGGPVTVRHQEHDGIKVPEGRYYIGRQIESAGAEERVVAD